MHERMAGLDSLAASTRSLRHRFEEIQMLLLDKPTREPAYHAVHFRWAASSVISLAPLWRRHVQSYAAAVLGFGAIDIVSSASHSAKFRLQPFDWAQRLIDCACL